MQCDQQKLDAKWFGCGLSLIRLGPLTRPAVEHAGRVLWRSISLKDKSYSSTADDTREMEAEMKEVENEFDKLYAFYIGFMSGGEPTRKSRRIRGKQPQP